jgi:hypothetical protein
MAFGPPFRGPVIGFFLLLLLIVSWYLHSKLAEMKKYSRALPKLPWTELAEEAIGRAAELGKPIVVGHGYAASGLESSSGANHMAGLMIGAWLHSVAVKYGVEFYIMYPWAEFTPIITDYIRADYAAVGKTVDPLKEQRYFAPDYWSYAAGGGGFVEEKKPSAFFSVGYIWAEGMVHIGAAAGVGAQVLGGSMDGNCEGWYVAFADSFLLPPEIPALSAFVSGDIAVSSSISGADILSIADIIEYGLGMLLVLAGQYTAVKAFINL